MKRSIAKNAIAIAALLFITSFSVLANKTSVKIIAPEKAEKGTEITIKIEVTHMGNTKGHYTDWVWVKVNGNEYKKWEYTPKNLPGNQNFTLEFTVKAEENMEIIAKGNCNRHGSKGEETILIKVE
ncbi:MAG: hypothetical protein A2X13_03810 [Bacteroidetes bacterium GWC2_33_15]|nr:MAG: hypothetical protein A2X10_02430 [Bacteroidetes bacterium GWA2_33_15]OFX49650.1 MAG: hypothetical protein A2X13_03810 [Bacteroidetes bacterium GWC2_33_15]OFX65960.1 MAG: hypothetical protein A2X15_11025 [Bacteroidetes bacterium GWB2_32_14]OFX68279.1 MAG: hypothetical protein A2X14_07870 [Bacteroidetes bacterium GWD2_33_33]HAN18061.1 hypothetical protein [Bacteroidales bacterium]